MLILENTIAIIEQVFFFPSFLFKSTMARIKPIIEVQPIIDRTSANIDSVEFLLFVFALFILLGIPHLLQNCSSLFIFVPHELQYAIIIYSFSFFIFFIISITNFCCSSFNSSNIIISSKCEDSFLMFGILSSSPVVK